MEKNHCDLEKLLSDAQQKYFGQFDGGKAAADLLQLASSLVANGGAVDHCIKSHWIVAMTCSILAHNVDGLLRETGNYSSRIALSTDCYEMQNIASILAACGEYRAAFDAMDRVRMLTSENNSLEHAAIKIVNSFLRIEVMLKLSEGRRFSNSFHDINSTSQIQEAINDVREVNRKFFYATHTAFVPKDVDVRYLSPPTLKRGPAGADQWEYSYCPSASSTDEHAPITRYGYLLLVGLVVEFRILLYCARQCIGSKRMAPAKEFIRSAMVLYAKHLKIIESRPSMALIEAALSASDTIALSPHGVASLQSLVGKCGNIAPSSQESMTFQMNRQYGIAMQILAQFYFHAKGYADALNTLCGSTTAQPVPLHYALRPIHTGTRGACTSNNLGCVLLQTGNPHSALLTLQRSRAQSNDINGVVTTSEGYQGSLRARDASAARYNEAVVLLRLNQPLPALALLESVEGPLLLRPHWWIRKAECYLMHHQLLSTVLAERPIEVEHVRTNLSEKHLIRFDRDRRFNIARLVQMVESTLQGSADGTPAYLADCVRCISTMAAGTEQGDQAGTARARHVAEQLRKAGDLSRAVDHLSTALGIITRALQRAKGDSASEGSLLGMKSSVLLKLAYLHLQLDNPHSAVLCSEELLQLPAMPSTNQSKHLAVSYHVEILCRLGREHEAAMALKASTAAFTGAWQEVLRGGGEPEDDGAGALAALGDRTAEGSASILSPTLFFSGAARIAELRSKPAAYGVLLKLLLRVNDAVVLMLRCELEAARVILEDVVRSDKDLVPAVQNLVYVYIKQGKVYDALGLLKVLHCMPVVN